MHQYKVTTNYAFHKREAMRLLAGAACVDDKIIVKINCSDLEIVFIAPEKVGGKLIQKMIEYRLLYSVESKKF